MSIINWELWHKVRGANTKIVTEIDPRFKMKKKTKIEQIVRDWQEASPAEVWEGVRDNFLFGFIGATLVVFIATRTDLAVFQSAAVRFASASYRSVPVAPERAADHAGAGVAGRGVFAPD